MTDYDRQDILDVFFRFIDNKIEFAQKNDYIINKIISKTLSKEDISLIVEHYNKMHHPNVKKTLENINNITLDNYLPIGTWNNIPSQYLNAKNFSSEIVLGWLSGLIDKARIKYLEKKDWLLEMILDIMAENRSFGYCEKSFNKFAEIAEMSKENRDETIDKILSDLNIASKENVALTAEEFYKVINIKNKKMDNNIKNTLDNCVEKLLNKKNILIGGPTNSGKELFFISLLNYLDKDLKIVIIDDTDELKLKNKNYTNLKITQSEITKDFGYDDVFSLACKTSPNILAPFTIYPKNIEALVKYLKAYPDIACVTTIFSGEGYDPLDKEYYSSENQDFIRKNFFFLQLDREGTPIIKE